MPKLTRIALLAVAVQQARKFAQTARGQQLIAQAKHMAGDPQSRAQLISQAKQAASDPQARTQLINQVKSAAGRGGASAGQPGATDPYPPATQPLTSASPLAPGPPGTGPSSIPPPPVS